jgi:hypothetical protein
MRPSRPGGADRRVSVRFGWVQAPNGHHSRSTALSRIMRRIGDAHPEDVVTTFPVGMTDVVGVAARSRAPGSRQVRLARSRRWRRMGSLTFPDLKSPRRVPSSAPMTLVGTTNPAEIMTAGVVVVSGRSEKRLRAGISPTLWSTVCRAASRSAPGGVRDSERLDEGSNARVPPEGRTTGTLNRDAERAAAIASGWARSTTASSTVAPVHRVATSPVHASCRGMKMLGAVAGSGSRAVGSVGVPGWGLWRAQSLGRPVLLWAERPQFVGGRPRECPGVLRARIRSCCVRPRALRSPGRRRERAGAKHRHGCAPPVL